MPRILCVGNGNLQVNFDRDLNIRDLYFPFVGMENHVSSHYCRFGIWIEGKFSWIDESWKKHFNYKEDSLVTKVSLKNETLQIDLEVEDTVHHFHDIFLRKVIVRNLSENEREIRLFFSQDLHLYDTDKGISAYYYPKSNAIIHFKNNRYFLISGSSDEGGLYQYAVGVTEFGGLTGTWKDAEDGILSNNPVAHGSVDSTVSLKTNVPGHGEKIFYYWITAGKQVEDIANLHKIVQKESPQKLIQETEIYSKNWVNKSQIKFGDLPERIIKMFKRSLLVLRTQIDNRGGIIASSDSDILHFNKDTYSYVWPRDGAFVSLGLDAAGYHQITQRFFKFCSKIIRRNGFLYQKYTADGSWASTWHAWIDPQGKFQLPIQEDETALVIYSLWNHYKQAKDIEFINQLYEPLICKAADFLVEYRDGKTNLPLPSYGLWEETRGISTFTTSTVYAGLHAAARFAELYGDIERSKKYQKAAEEVKIALLEFLYDDQTGQFLKLVKPSIKGNLIKDQTIDSSVFAIFEFGFLPADDPRVEKTMNQIKTSLWVNSEVGGIARYQNDYYQQVSQDIEKVPGNPWIICTLWLAEYYIEKAKSSEELKPALDLLEWVINHSLESGILPEQINPYTGTPLSVSPI